MKDQLGGRTIEEYVTLRLKMHSYIIDDGCDDKKANSTKKGVVKCQNKFEDY